MSSEGKEKKGFFKRLVQGLTKTRDNIVSGIDSIFSGFSSIIKFKSLACLPVSRRTPIASYITTIASTKLMAKAEDPTPQQIPAAVVKLHTVAEWELGIPPEPTSRSALKLLFRQKSNNVFNTCASVQPATALIST